MDVDTRNVRAALNLDDALRMLSASEASAMVPEPEADQETDADAE
jgi:hypothetical protein